MTNPLGLHLGLGFTQGGGFSPLSLFAASEQGAWYDPSDLSSMSQDSAGSTPVTAAGQVVGRILDKSGRGNHATQSTTASKPVLRQSGALYYLEFDGVDDFLVTSAINFSATDAMSVFAGVRKLSDAAVGMVAELSTNATGNNGTFYWTAPATASGGDYRWVSRGTVTSTVAPNGLAAPVTNLLTGQGKISTDTCSTRVDGVDSLSSTADQGTGNFGNYPLYIGRRGGTTQPFSGHIYGLIVRGALTADPVPTETWLNAKTGAF